MSGIDKLAYGAIGIPRDGFMRVWILVLLVLAAWQGIEPMQEWQ